MNDPPPNAGIPAGPRRLRATLLVLGISLGLVVLFTGQTLLRARFLDVPADVKNLLIESLTRWLSYAAIVPAVGALVARAPLERGHHLGRWPLHIAAAFGFAFLHCVVMALVYRTFHIYPREDTFLEAIGHLVLVFFAVNSVIFGAIDGIFHAIRYHFDAVRREQVAADLRAHLAESRLDGLRAQMHPHFLFNTLNAVSTLVLAGEREAVVRVVSRLGDLLRVSFDRDLPQEIPVRDELDLLDRYLDIQKTRFGERLTVISRIAPDARAALVPSMLLQPLVENALRHGIESRPGPGQVVIAADRVNDTLRIRIEDSGPGFTAQPAPDGNGIGLSNSRARLQQLYGERQSFSCGNLAAGGAFVEVVVPFRGEPPARVNGAR